MRVSRTALTGLSIITGLAAALIRGVPRRVLVAVAVIGALAVPAASQARAVGTAASVSPLQAVTCTSGGNCWAVGGAYQTGAGFIERWNGSAWRVVPSQNPPKSSSSVLDGVACAQVTSCWAVGYYVTATGAAILPYEARRLGPGPRRCVPTRAGLRRQGRFHPVPGAELRFPNRRPGARKFGFVTGVEHGRKQQPSQ